jgi:hypothetical protein
MTSTLLGASTTFGTGFGAEVTAAKIERPSVTL